MVEWVKEIGDYGFNTFVCQTKIKKYFVIQSWDFVALAHASLYNGGDTIIMPC